MCREIVVSFFLILSLNEYAAEFSYDCSITDGSIKVINPDPKIYTYIFANDDNTICQVKWSSERKYATITKCDQDQRIFILLSNRTQGEDRILGGIQNKMFSIYCHGLPSTGIYRTVHHLFHAEFETTMMHPVTPYLAIGTEIYTNRSMTEVVKSARIGQKLFWVIHTQHEYELLPVACIAFSGRTHGGVSKKIIRDGCSLDQDLVSDFKMDVELDMISADFFAFCFRDSPYITISCNVKICPKGSQECTITCYDHYRVRRRDTEDNITLEKVSTNLYIVDAPILVDSAHSYARLQGGSEVMKHTNGQKLVLIDQNVWLGSLLMMICHIMWF